MSTDPLKFQYHSVPAATDKASAAVAGKSKAKSSIWQSYINAMERRIEEEKSPARRENIEVVLNFIRQHGYPAQGYRFLLLTMESSRWKCGPMMSFRTKTKRT